LLISDYRVWKGHQDLKEVFEGSKTETFKDIETYKKTYADKDWKQFTFFTHRIRGTFLYFASPRVEEAFGYLEEYLKKAKKIDKKIVGALYELVLPELYKALEEISRICSAGSF
jgi:hypothetical protein